MNFENLKYLRERAEFYKNYLKEHEVLRDFWSELSLVMKGSTARGYSDMYSDVDFVIFTDGDTKNKIAAAYVEKGLSSRTDGVFLPLGDWEGHYNLDTYDKLKTYFVECNMMYVWEYTNVVIMHDGTGLYEKIIKEGQENVFKDQDKLIREKYVEIQLYLDWLRQPLRRADKGASLMYASNTLRFVSQMIYLLNTSAYPSDKWLFYYLKDMEMPDELRKLIAGYPDAFESIGNIEPHRELMDYDLYAKGFDMVCCLSAWLKEQYDNPWWIDEWYLLA